MKTDIMDQTQKMYPYDCVAVAGAAIALLKSGLKKKTKREKTLNFLAADELIKGKRFTWDNCPDDLFDEYDTLVDQLIEEIN